MKPIVLLVAAATMVMADPRPFVAQYKTWGPREVFRGSTNWYQTQPQYAFDITCNAETDTCAAADYLPQEGESGTLSTTGTPPGGLYTVYSNVWPSYAICEVNGNSFRLHRFHCGGVAEDITNAGTGVHTFLLSVWGYRPIFLDSAQGMGFPAGVSFTWTMQTQAACSESLQPFVDYASGKSFSYAGTYVWCFKMTVSPSVPPGSYAGTFRFCQTADGVNCSDQRLEFDVIELPEQQYGNAAAVPAIDGIADWEALLTNRTDSRRGGLWWCPDPASGRTEPSEMTAWEGNTWYYDGGKTFFNIAQYLKQRNWDNCARTVTSWYKSYVTENGGWFPLYRYFPDGLALSASRTATGRWDGTFRAALKQMLTTNVLSKYGPIAAPSYEREIAYAAGMTVAWRKYFGEKRSNYDQFIDTLIGFMMMYTDQQRPLGYQTFMGGLVMEPLIEHWELTKDRRVPYVVKRLIDDIWSNYDPTSHTIMYNTAPDASARCADQPVWFNGGTDNNCRAHTGQVLQNLLAYAFAWYWKLSGEDVYRVRADDLFRYGNAACCFTGKEFSQNFRKAFDFVRWRSAR